MAGVLCYYPVNLKKLAQGTIKNSLAPVYKLTTTYRTRDSWQPLQVRVGPVGIEPTRGITLGGF